MLSSPGHIDLPTQLRIRDAPRSIRTTPPSLHFAVRDHAGKPAVHRTAFAAQPPARNRSGRPLVAICSSVGVEENQTNKKSNQQFGRPVHALAAAPTELGDGKQHQRRRGKHRDVHGHDIQPRPATDDEDEVGHQRDHPRQHRAQHGRQAAESAADGIQHNDGGQTAEQR